MPSKNMLPKGHRHRSVRAEYVATRGVEPELPVAVPVAAFDDGPDGAGRREFLADGSAAGMRVDLYLAQALEDVSRARVQMMLEGGLVRVDGVVPRAKDKLKGGERIALEGEARPEALRAVAEDIPLEMLYEDRYVAVVNKPAGMMVHAGAGATEDERNAGTLVNALLFHLQKAGTGREGGLSGVGGELRPGIVHRLDKQTSGAIVVAKDDVTHRKLGAMFAAREVHKTYVALAHGHLQKDDTTVTLPIARDLVRRVRMTTRRADGRTAVSHVHVLERLETAYGLFTMVRVQIETGRTHQIRVHLQALGHPVVGDTVYGAPRVMRRGDGEGSLELGRNFLHAAELEFRHPRTGKNVRVEAPLAAELVELLERLRG